MNLQISVTTSLITDEEKKATKEFVKNFKHQKKVVVVKKGFSYDHEKFKEYIKNKRENFNKK